MKVLIGCEASQTVCKAFRKLGHEAYSCDIQDEYGGHPEWHLKMDVFEAVKIGGWDLAIFHPDCTFLTVTGNSWFYHPEDKLLPTTDRRPHPRFPNRRNDQLKAIQFFKDCYSADIPKIAVENPVGIMSTVFKKPNQYIHPYQFGDPHSKKTGLWLKNLPILVPTNIVEPQWYIYDDGRRDPLWHVETLKLEPKERARQRSKTFEGIANAMATQWTL